MAKVLGKPVVLKADSQGEMSGAFFSDGLKRFGISSSSLPFRLFLGVRNAFLRRADAHSAITNGLEEELRAGGVREDAIHRIPNCVDTSRFAPVGGDEKLSIRRKLGIPPDARVVTYTGRLVSYKGLPLLLRVWQDLCGHHAGIRLVLVGTGGLDIHNCEEELRTFVDRHRMERSVTFTGGVENVPEYLQASDIFAFPTENDAFPSSLVEAMACRLPVVTTPVGAIPEIVQDGRNGLMVEPGRAEGLFRALDRLLSDPALARGLGEEGWRTVRDRFSADLVTREYLDLFNGLCSP
jgi:glycosyltransferase involved in cell wall biosynthesis